MLLAISKDKTTFPFVMTKSLKHKLQIMADADIRSLGNYISKILEQHIIEIETKIYEVYGEKDFNKEYAGIFGHEYPPLLNIKKLEMDRAIKEINDYLDEDKPSSIRTSLKHSPDRTSEDLTQHGIKLNQKAAESQQPYNANKENPPE